MLACSQAKRAEALKLELRHPLAQPSEQASMIHLRLGCCRALLDPGLSQGVRGNPGRYSGVSICSPRAVQAQSLFKRRHSKDGHRVLCGDYLMGPTKAFTVEAKVGS